MAGVANLNTVTVVNNEVRMSPNEAQDPLLSNVLFIVNTFTNMCIGAITFISIIYAMAWRYAVTPLLTPHLYRLHIYFCVIGYMIMLSQAALAFHRNNGWSMGMNKRTKSFAHMGMQVIGSIFVIVGSVLKMTDTRSTNFRSAHGIFGFAALILTIVTLIGGIRNMYCSNMLNANSLKLAHNVFGVSTIITAYISLCFGFSHDYFRAWMSFYNPMINLCIALTVMALIGIIVGTTGNLIYRRQINLRMNI